MEGKPVKYIKDYDQDTDRELFVKMMTKYRDDIDTDQWPSEFQTVQDKYKGDFEAYAEKIYPKSPLRSAEAFAMMWCLLFVLIRQGLRGGSGPQRLIRALGIETGNPIMTYEQRSSFLPSFERAPHHTSPRIP